MEMRFVGQKKGQLVYGVNQDRLKIFSEYIEQSIKSYSVFLSTRKYYCQYRVIDGVIFEGSIIGETTEDYSEIIDRFHADGFENHFELKF